MEAPGLGCTPAAAPTQTICLGYRVAPVDIVATAPAPLDTLELACCGQCQQTQHVIAMRYGAAARGRDLQPILVVGYRVTIQGLVGLSCQSARIGEVPRNLSDTD